MLTKEMNEKLTRVGPGTPTGELMRRYWHPVAAVVELEENPVKKVRLLCEDLVLFRDRSGNLGLIDEPCPHRRVSMEYGIPEETGLRCPYHGWLFNQEGQCIEQPAEPWNSTFKDRVSTKAYPVQELGGLIFAYLGPLPAPVLPRYDLLVWNDVLRHVGSTMLNCNFMQCMENSLDPVHVEWLHGYYMDYVWSSRDPNYTQRYQARHKKIGFDRFEHGLIKRRVMEGASEEDHPWQVGHPIIFPNILRVGGAGNYQFQYRVPVDDTHTWQVTYIAYRPRIPVPPQDSIPMYEIPLKDADGKYRTEVTLVQDFFAWDSQGPVAARELEHLGQTDIGVIMYRELLREQVEKVERGEDPIGMFRSPAPNGIIELPQEEVDRDPVTPNQPYKTYGLQVLMNPGTCEQFSPLRDTLIDLFRTAEEMASRGEPLMPPLEPPVYPPGRIDHRAVQLLQ